MPITETLEDRIKRHEGLRLTPYGDSLGFQTIGWGHKILPEEHFTVITLQEAQTLFDKDMAKARADVSRYIPCAAMLPGIVQGVLIEMCFQLGIQGVLGFHTMLACAESGDLAGMASAMIKSLWDRQTPNRVLELVSIVTDAAKEQLA